MINKIIKSRLKKSFLRFWCFLAILQVSNGLCGPGRLSLCARWDKSVLMLLWYIFQNLDLVIWQWSWLQKCWYVWWYFHNDYWLVVPGTMRCCSLERNTASSPTSKKSFSELKYEKLGSAPRLSVSWRFRIFPVFFLKDTCNTQILKW